MLMLFEMYACNKQAKPEVYLTDDPANYSEVNIDIQNVLINVSNGEENRKELPIAPGVYNCSTSEMGWMYYWVLSKALFCLQQLNLGPIP